MDKIEKTYGDIRVKQEDGWVGAFATDESEAAEDAECGVHVELYRNTETKMYGQSGDHHWDFIAEWWSLEGEEQMRSDCSDWEFQNIIDYALEEDDVPIDCDLLPRMKQAIERYIAE